ncbi:MAG: hypothetical protein KF708_11240 [Pirellulales bacterium]|nr:hypothetical protein [Pirellulales bacterium]
MTTAIRTTIPRRLDAIVVARTSGREKHPGFDDACLLTLDDGRTIQVEPELFHAVAIGDRLHKERWDEELKINDRTLSLHSSADEQGMLRTMPLALVVMLAQFVWAVRK